MHNAESESSARVFIKDKGRRGGRPPKFDAEAYKGRQVVERGFNRLKDLRAMTRYGKCGQQFLAAFHVTAILLWL